MIKHAAILAVSVAAALGAAQLASAVGAAKAEPKGVSPTAAAPEASPAAEPAAPAGAATLSKSMDGHFWAEAEVDGRWVRFLVDTGASTVALTETDARRVGVDISALRYSFPVSTANGRTLAAPTVLNHVAVAGARVEAVPALVVKEGLATSLLGMSYLGRLSRFEATPTTLILRP